MDNNELNKTVAMSNILLLENTRVLFDFMEEMSDIFSDSETDKTARQYDGYIGVGSLAERSSRIKTKTERIEECLKECVDKYDTKKPGNFLRQNHLYSYMRFYKKMFGDIDSEYDKIAEMLNYFNILRFLTEPEYKENRHKNTSFDTLPYVFEDMCLSIKNMTGAKSCYLLYKKEGEPAQLISRSGYVLDESNDILPIDGKIDMFSPLHIGAAGFNMLIKLCRQSSDNDKPNNLKPIKLQKNETIAEGLIRVSTKQSKDDNDNDNVFNHQFMIFDFPYREGESGGYNDSETGGVRGKDRRYFFVILDLGDFDTNNAMSLIKMSIRVLFLRNRLLEALRKYYAGMLNFRYYCNYIRTVGKKEDEKNVRILHLTDMHILDDDSWSRGSNNLNELMSELKGRKIDLIAVTGDVVNASNDAATAQRRYKRAANLLFEIAKTLWSEGEILPHDWKRRILITTGNHDYAAMNDMRVQTESRKITSGLPAKSTGGTMSKYTYYLEFLSEFLDAPTQRLLGSDLNEVRTYDHFNLMIGIFNSCSQANALQNNKVAFDREKINIIVNNANWRDSDRKHIALAHHYPSYFINYFDDKYGIWKFKRTDSYNSLKIAFGLFIYRLGEYLKDLNMIEEVDFNALMESTYKSLKIDKPDNGNEFEEKFMELKNSIATHADWKIADSELFKDMEKLLALIKEYSDSGNTKTGYRNPPEYVYQFQSEAAALFKTMQDDNNDFKNDWKYILNHPNLTVLAGHTHEAKVNMKGECDYNEIIGHLFYDGSQKDTPVVFEIVDSMSDVGRKRYVYCRYCYNDKKNIKCNMPDVCNAGCWLCDGEEDNEDIEKVFEKQKS